MFEFVFFAKGTPLANDSCLRRRRQHSSARKNVCAGSGDGMMNGRAVRKRSLQEEHRCFVTKCRAKPISDAAGDNNSVRVHVYSSNCAESRKAGWCRSRLTDLVAAASRRLNPGEQDLGNHNGISDGVGGSLAGSTNADLVASRPAEWEIRKARRVLKEPRSSLP